MLKKIELTGRLAKKFGKVFYFDIENVTEGIRALCHMIDGFENELKKGAYRVFRLYDDKREIIGQERLELAFGEAIGFRLEPALVGKKSGLLQIILGIILVGAAFLFSGGALAGMAISSLGISFGQVAVVGGLLALSGIAQMLTPTISDTTEEKRSFIVDSPSNRIAEGTAIPIAIGDCFIGSVTVSNGITTEDFDDD